jgi:cation:H+ antiporter
VIDARLFESPVLLILLFVACAAIIVVAGVRLAFYGDCIATRTGLGGLWIGSILLAGATSLPELATDIAAVRIGAPDLAAGDLFGSSMSNMLILAMLDLMYPRAQIFRSATLDHVISAMLAIILTAIAALFLLVRTDVSVLGIGPGSVLLVIVYFAGTRALYLHNAAERERRAAVEEAAAASPGGTPAAADQAEGGGLSLRQAIVRFGIVALAILLVAPVFASSAEGIAEVSGLGSTLVGTWLVGFSTSLPELVASLAAVRMRAYDMAVGNLFGSNALNMIVFAVLDAVSPSGPILATVSPVHALSALIAIALMATGMAAIAYRAHGRVRMLEPSSTMMVLLYLLGMGVLLARATGG